MDEVWTTYCPNAVSVARCRHFILIAVWADDIFNSLGFFTGDVVLAL